MKDIYLGRIEIGCEKLEFTSAIKMTLSLSLAFSINVCTDPLIYDAFRETKLHDRANRGSVEHSGLRSPWELPRIASREPRI